MNISSDAFVLHRRAYQNSGAIIAFLSRSHGRVDAVAKGATVKAGKSRFSLTPFQCQCIVARGKNDLLSLHSSEPQSPPYSLTGQSLFCGLYVNELLYALLPKHENNTRIVDLYINTLDALTHADSLPDLEIVLRTFEQYALDALGYGVQFTEAETGDALQLNARYRYQEGHGFIQVKPSSTTLNNDDYLGESLLAIAEKNYATATIRMDAKRLMRRVIQSHLGNKILKSRELFYS